MPARNTKKVRVEPLLFDTYLAIIKGSVESKMFQNFYARVNGTKKEITLGGRLSCAFFVSSLLKLFDLVESIHPTVHHTLLDMERSGWKKIKSPRLGCVVICVEDKRKFKADEKLYPPTHKHIGFFVGAGKAISNRREKRTPISHLLRFRPVLAYYWHKRLESRQVESKK